MSKSNQPRGIRNNNPGNIDYNAANNWQGQLPYDRAIESRFCRFVSPEYGIRALMALLRTYQRKYGLNTVSGLISRWAPSKENNTNSYVNAVAKEIGVSPQDNINVFDKDMSIKLAKAIIRHENGQQPYGDPVFETAFKLL